MGRGPRSQSRPRLPSPHHGPRAARSRSQGRRSRRAAAGAQRRALTAVSTARRLLCDGGRGAPRAQRRPVLRPQPPEGDPAGYAAAGRHRWLLSWSLGGWRRWLGGGSEGGPRPGQAKGAAEGRRHNASVMSSGARAGGRARRVLLSLAAQAASRCTRRDRPATSDKAPYRTCRSAATSRSHAATPCALRPERAMGGRGGWVCGEGWAGNRASVSEPNAGCARSGGGRYSGRSASTQTHLGFLAVVFVFRLGGAGGRAMGWRQAEAGAAVAGGWLGVWQPP